MDYQPINSASSPEELEDHWVVTVPPLSSSGNYGIRFLSTNIDGSTGISPQAVSYTHLTLPTTPYV